MIYNRNMKSFFIIVFFTLFNTSVFSDTITGTWYRNEVFRLAEIEIDENMHFVIDASNAGYSGYFEGYLTRIKDGYYFSLYYGTIQNGLMVLVEHDAYLEIIIYGDQIRASKDVYYDGKYERHQIPPEEYRDRALDEIIENNYDINIIKALLQNDIGYFIQCFERRKTTDNGNSLLIEGGNGIMKIENGNVYILTVRDRPVISYQYYTSDIFQEDIPEEFKKSGFYRDTIFINKKIGL
jgi:hypothetical protein